MAAAEPQTGQALTAESVTTGSVTVPSGTTSTPVSPSPTQPETVSREDHQRELDRYRNQVGQEKKKAEELAAELAALKEAGKSEAEKIAAKASEYDALLPRVKSLEKALKAQVEAIRGQLSEPLQALIPEGVVELQFDHAQKLLAAQSQIVPTGNQTTPQMTLPDTGGRTPARVVPGSDDSRANEMREVLPALRGLTPARKGVP